jgi:hypothetical protein
MADVLFDFDNPGDAERSLKKVAQVMQRAGQAVVSHSFDPKLRRSSGVNYRQALLTLASGQLVTLMVKQTGDVFRVLLNGAALPIKNQDSIKALGEIAAAAERNQVKFQASQARKKVALPKGIRTAAPKMAEALAQRNSELDALISEKIVERNALKTELGEALDAVGDDAGKAESAELKPWTGEHAAALQLAASIEAGTALDAVDDLAAAIASLQVALDTVENNAPINEAAGHVEQAALERESAESFRKALAILDDAANEEFEPAEGQEQLFAA